MTQRFWPHRSRLLTVLRETVPVLAVALAVLTVLGLARPASAQFLNFPFFDGPPQRQRGSGGGGLFGGGNDAPYFAPFQQAPRRVVREDFSKAPSPERKAEATQPERSVVVLGDAMADWLAYGLEEAYADQPDIGVLRRHKAGSGLIRYQPKGDPADWPSAVRGVLAPENPAAVVIMLGLNDRVALREPAKADKADAKKPADAAKTGEGKAADTKTGDTKPNERDAELSDDPGDIADPPPILAPEKSVRSAGGVYEFREDRWVELYTRKIEDMIAAAKTKGVPVVWVGLPAIRGAKATSDMLFLNAIYRDVAQKSGITFVDVWDGFVDESGRFMQQGPDFEGQTRRLRSYDGVYFTKPGARKLAHYVDREINRLLAVRAAPVAALPTEPEKPDLEVKPGGPPPRPLAGPILPLTVASVASDQLLGGGSSKPVMADALVTRTLTKGEPLTPAPGRADDGAWPRREVGRETAPKGGDMPEMAAVTDGVTPVMASPSSIPPADAQKKRKIRPIQPMQQASPAGGGFDFFGLGGGFSQAQSQASAQPQTRQRQPVAAYPQQPRDQVRAPSLFGQAGSGFGGLFSR